MLYGPDNWNTWSTSCSFIVSKRGQRLLTLKRQLSFHCDMGRLFCEWKRAPNTYNERKTVSTVTWLDPVNENLCWHGLIPGLSGAHFIDMVDQDCPCSEPVWTLTNQGVACHGGSWLTTLSGVSLSWVTGNFLVVLHCLGGNRPVFYETPLATTS